MSKVKKLSKKIIFAIVCAAIIGTLLLALMSLWIAYLVADEIECWRPDYEKVDISGIFDKQTLTDDDYDILFRQTGLTKIGVDRMRARGDAGKMRTLAIQSDYFEEHKVGNTPFGFLVCTDYIEKHVAHCFLENGDIIVTSSSHFSGWRMGHAGIVTDAEMNYVLQSGVLGETSKVEWMSDFTDRVNFMVLSPKVGTELKAEVAKYARENLTGKEFSIFTGLFTDKNKVDKTHCSHLVWYAYKQFGIDLDSNGGGLVVSRDIYRSPYVEVVQVFGFDPEVMW